MSKPRGILPVIFACGASALVGFLGLLSRPNVADIRTVDMVRLLSTGVALGATLVALVGLFVLRHRGPG
jgi:hypothetical protein